MLFDARWNLCYAPPIQRGNHAEHVANQELIVESALARDPDLAFQAVYNDPASGLPVDQAWQMYQAMLRASRDYLPGWSID